MNLTITAFYGTKPPALGRLIATMQAELSGLLGNGFTRYDGHQVHATLVGLEGLRGKGGGIVNTGLAQAGIADAAMDLAGLFRFLKHTDLLPLRIRIGGFAPDTDYGFTSRGDSPYIRSCIIDNGRAVIMGWPHDDSGYPPLLDRLRRSCMDFNVLHKYHSRPGDIDNDLFFVLGHVRTDAEPSPDTVAPDEDLRRRLHEMDPLDLSLGRGQLKIVAYTDRMLPHATSRAFTLEQALRSPEALATLYGT